MSMDLIMVLRGQYTAGEDMEQRLQDLTEQSILAKSLGYWGVAVPSHFSGAPLQYFHQTSMLAYLAAQVRDIKLIIRDTYCTADALGERDVQDRDAFELR